MIEWSVVKTWVRSYHEEVTLLRYCSANDMPMVCKVGRRGCTDWLGPPDVPTIMFATNCVYTTALSHINQSQPRITWSQPIRIRENGWSLISSNLEQAHGINIHLPLHRTDYLCDHLCRFQCNKSWVWYNFTEFDQFWREQTQISSNELCWSDLGLLPDTVCLFEKDYCVIICIYDCWTVWGGEHDDDDDDGPHLLMISFLAMTPSTLSSCTSRVSSASQYSFSGSQTGYTPGVHLVYAVHEHSSIHVFTVALSEPN